METVLEAIPTLAQRVPLPLIYLGACIGHAYLLVLGINFLYSFRAPHWLLHNLRRFDLVVILGGPIWFALLLGFPFGRWADWSDGAIDRLGLIYAVLCFVLATVVAPINQIRYWLRRYAPQVTQKKSEVVDIVKVLGFPPIGASRYERLPRIRGNQCFQVEFLELHLTLPNLPAALEGLTILHLTDLHFIGTPDRWFYKAAIDHTQRWGTPDLVAITGDVVDSPWHHRWILPILGRLRWNVGAFYLLGNHDLLYEPARTRRRLNKLGLVDLGNAWRTLNVRGEQILIVGNEYPWFKPRPDLHEAPDDLFTLALSHSPDQIGWAQKNQIDLMLAGHVHGGQIRAPWIGSVFVPSRYSRRYDFGTFYEKPTVMHVSRGLAGQHPLRFNCRPEVTWIVLHREQKTIPETGLPD